MAREKGMTVDLAGYQAALTEQKERGRASAQFDAQGTEGVQVYLDLLRELKAEGCCLRRACSTATSEDLEVETSIVALLREGGSVASVRSGEKVEVVLAETPFYVESGGQVTDTGFIARYLNEDEEEPIWEIRVDEVRRPVPGLIVHVGEVTMGQIAVGEKLGRGGC